MKPLFSVGEECILQSRKFPGCNGLVTVIRIQDGGHNALCPHCGREGVCVWDGFAYYLDIKSPAGCCNAWDQSALRKKYDKGMKFVDLMSDLKSRVTQ